MANNTDEILRQADKKKLKILAIADGDIKCSYHDAMKAIDDYSEFAAQNNGGFLFLAGAKYLIEQQFQGKTGINDGITM